MTSYYLGPQDKVVLVLFFTNTSIIDATTYYLVHKVHAKYCESMVDVFAPTMEMSTLYLLYLLV
jgi:hypothetical protein